MCSNAPSLACVNTSSTASVHPCYFLLSNRTKQRTSAPLPPAPHTRRSGTSSPFNQTSPPTSMPHWLDWGTRCLGWSLWRHLAPTTPQRFCWVGRPSTTGVAAMLGAGLCTCCARSTTAVHRAECCRNLSLISPVQYVLAISLPAAAVLRPRHPCFGHPGLPLQFWGSNQHFTALQPVAELLRQRKAGLTGVAEVAVRRWSPHGPRVCVDLMLQVSTSQGIPNPPPLCSGSMCSSYTSWLSSIQGRGACAVARLAPSSRAQGLSACCLCAAFSAHVVRLSQTCHHISWLQWPRTVSSQGG
jgi:hypothetical protein